MVAPIEVAQWMLEKIETAGELYQEEAVYHIASMFGEEFTYANENGNPAIDRRVLREFRKLTEDFVVWERAERYWRKRAHGEAKGRRLAD